MTKETPHAEIKKTVNKALNRALTEQPRSLRLTEGQRQAILERTRRRATSG